MAGRLTYLNVEKAEQNLEYRHEVDAGDDGAGHHACANGLVYDALGACDAAEDKVAVAYVADYNAWISWLENTRRKARTRPFRILSPIVYLGAYVFASHTPRDRRHPS